MQEPLGRATPLWPVEEHRGASKQVRVTHEYRARSMDDSLAVKGVDERSYTAAVSSISEELSIGMRWIEIHAIRRQSKRIALAIAKQVLLNVCADCFSGLVCERRVRQHRTQFP